MDTRGDANLKDKVTGCLMSLNPDATSSLMEPVDWYCVPRDMTAAKFNINYLATSPLIAVNARGPGAHTAFVMQWDTVLFAFDPSNLKAGPLYVLDPLPNADDITVATDFLAMTAGGSLLWEGWDATANDATVLALPGALVVPVAPGPTGGKSSSTAGRDAGIAIGVILGLGAAAGGFVWYAGGMAAAGALVSGALSSLKVGGGGAAAGSKGFGSSYAAVSSAGLSSGAALKSGGGGYGSL